MRRITLSLLGIATAALVAVPVLAQQQQQASQQRFAFGQAATPQEIAGWDIDVRPPGVGLPAGQGTVAAGKQVYDQQCAVCHGDKGQGGMGDRLVGGMGTLASAHPVKTVGSYWPYAATLFDYVRRAMPFTNPQSLTNDQVYAVTAYVLFLNDIVPQNAVMNAESLPKVEMPNRNGFTTPDPRPDTHDRACMSGCRSLTAATPPPIQPNRSQSK
jgi:cytochrome c